VNLPDWAIDLGIKVAVPVVLGAGAWAWKTGRRLVKTVVWLADIQQANANHLRRVAQEEGLDHRRLDIITDALEDSRYPERGMVPPERQRRKHGTLAIEDREGVENLRRIRALIRAGKGVPE